MMDFNEVSTFSSAAQQAERDALRSALLSRLESVLFGLFPAGKVKRGVFLIGDVLGSPGDSLEVVLCGEKAGLWTDRATGEGGDIFDLIAAASNMDSKMDFARLLQRAGELVYHAPAVVLPKGKKQPAIDDLGPATAKWEYRDAQGNLLAVVYRYDPPGRKKEFRPWDAKRRKTAPPDPRPIYNQPGLLNAQQVVLVEGEKCAQALIDLGMAATTAMHGANAPVEKTDWSPLAGKTVLVWPDRDKAGWDYAMAAAQAALGAGALACDVLLPPDEQVDGWDAADAIAECFDVHTFITTGPRMSIKPASATPTQEPSVWATDDALALSFTTRYAEDWRYCAAWGKWLLWDGRRWHSDETLLIHDLIRVLCREAALKADSHRLAARLACSSTVNGVERLARSDRRHSATANEWDIDPWSINTTGGIIDLKTGQQRRHERKHLMTKIVQASAQGDCPTWRAFLAEITGDDTQLQAYLQRMAGYMLTGSTQEHALFFLYGTGANGKSVFVNTLTSILGDYATHAPIDTFMEVHGDRHPTDLAGLRGARFVSAIETEQGRRWNESKLKALTGGDKISARFMRQDFFDYLPQFKLIIAGNHKPLIRNINEAMKRRLHLIPFTVTIPAEKRDAQLIEKLLAERNGILAWAVEGCLQWLQHRLNPPSSVLSATEDYFDEQDAIGDFIKEEVVQLEQARIAIADIFQRWQEWADWRGEYVGTSRWLAQQLVNRGFERTRLHGGTKAISALSLKPKPHETRMPYCD